MCRWAWHSPKSGLWVRDMNDKLHPELKPVIPHLSHDALLDRFLTYVDSCGLELYPAQEEAILELFADSNVILNTPTGSGKSLVAAAMHYKSCGTGKKSVYTCPIKALVNEKFLSLCRDFGAENVGMMTGDASVNRNAPILCCTAEILSNIALNEGADSSIADVIMDEFHYYSDPERGVAWQTPLLTMKNARFLLMSATMGETEFFKKVIEDLTQTKTVVVKSSQRPVPLDFNYSEINLPETIEKIKSENKLPVYIVHFTQLKAAETAQNLTSINFCTKEEKEKINNELKGVAFTSPFGKEIKKFLKHGVGLHHAGLLPKYRILVEQMAQKGLLRVICGTDTLGVGVNVPIRSVLLTQLCKYDGTKTRILNARDFHQICGRAGRRGFDDQGSVICQAPEHVIENLKMERKAAKDPGKKKKMVKKKPPERGFVNWSEDTFRKLINAEPEPLVSSFDISHGMLLNVLSRESDGCEAMREIIRNCHESDHSKSQLRKKAWNLFRSLADRDIIELLPEQLRNGAKVRVNLDLQEDFSLNQALSLFMIDTMPKLDPESPQFVADVITLVESILENPHIILRKQLDKLKDKAVAEMKQKGVSFEERMEELDKLEYPKPNREFIYNSFNEFASIHPWVGAENIQPKSIGREMYESFMSFNDYIKAYGLQKSEGILLRHLSNVFKVIDQTIPEQLKSDEIDEAAHYFESMIRGTDSSLLDEWEKIHDSELEAESESESNAPAPDADAEQNKSEIKSPRKERPSDITAFPARMEIELRTQIFEILRAFASGNLDDLLIKLTELSTSGEAVDSHWNKEKLEDILDTYLDSHGHARTDPEARNKKHTHIKKDMENGCWHISQTLIDPEELNDWSMDFQLSLPATREANRVRLDLQSIGPISG